MDCFVGMLIGLLKTRNINLTEIALGFASDRQPESRYRRVQRFIHSHHINFDSVAWFVMALFGFIDSPYYLAMDRTNWKWGKKNINILVLAVVYKIEPICSGVINTMFITQCIIRCLIIS